jgi:predicted lipoprotein with Yx(FWY)xxD motif
MLSQRVAAHIASMSLLAICAAAGCKGSPPARGADVIVVKTATATVAGITTTILTTGVGMTLYYSTADSAIASACTDACARTWPPLLATTKSPKAAATVPGTLGVLTDANGAQVTFNGHPLYTYTGDHTPDETHGNGIAGRWFVARPSLAVLLPPAASPTGTCTGFYCS